MIVPTHLGKSDPTSGQEGRLLEFCVACSLIPVYHTFVWGELMQTAVYVSNRVPHVALANEMPYTEL